MTSLAAPFPGRRVMAGHGRIRWVWTRVAAVGFAFLAVTLLSTAAHLEVLPASGDEPVGRDRLILVDVARPELHTADSGDVRSVPIELWYPAEADTGRPADYLQDLASISEGLIESGAVSRFEATGLSFVRTSVREDAVPVNGSHPVLILSPGNETNVGFYASTAEELASHGYLVIGIDHPYQVAATKVAGGTVALYDRDMDRLPPGEAIAAKVDERVADVLFVIDSLRARSEQLSEYAATADLERIGVLGHSNGGLTAFEVCRLDSSIDACLNMDGQAAGGALGAREGATAPSAPFLYLTKETFVPAGVADRFETAEVPAVRVVVPDAHHDSFTDGPLFQPGINPTTTSAQRIARSIRSVTLAFFDQWLKHQEARPFDGLDAPADLYINVYPLEGLQPIPHG